MQAFSIFPFLLSATVIGTIFEAIGNLIDENLMSGPGTRAWDNRVRGLRERLAKLTDGLVPWDAEMLRLLSLHRSVVQKPGRFFARPAGGVFTSIYQEPVLAYVVENRTKNRLLIARTSSREVIIRLKEREMEIWIDRQPLGVLVKGALLAAGKGSKVLARFDPDDEADQTVLYINDHPAAMLTNPGRADSPMPRALTLLRELGSEEENIALALTLVRMVPR